MWAYARASTRAPGTKIRPVVGLIALPDLSSRIGLISYQLSRSAIRTLSSGSSASRATGVAANGRA